MLLPQHQKHAWLIGTIVFFLLGVAGILSLPKSEKPASPGTTAPPATPPAAPPRTAPQVPKPEPPAPKPSLPQPSVKQIDSDHWRVVLPRSNGWFETGIPVAVNQEASIHPDGASSAKWLTKIDHVNQVLFKTTGYYTNVHPVETLTPKDYYSVNAQYNLIDVPLDYCGTIKLKIDDESPEEVLTLIVQVDDDHYYRGSDDQYSISPDRQLHREAHAEARRKVDALKRKIAR